jgi:hypothetical protein
MAKLKLFVADCLYENAIQEIKDLVLSTGSESYEGNMDQVYDQHYANFGSYSRYFDSPNWSVVEVLVNSLETQNLWRLNQDRNPINQQFWRISYQFTKKRFLKNLAPFFSPMHRTLLKQVKSFHPDVLILTDLHLYPASVLRKFKSQNLLLVGHISSQIHEGTPLEMYDLLLSSIDKYLLDFQKMGIESFKFLPAFDYKCLPKIPSVRDIDCVFLGSVYPGTAPLLHEVKKHVPNIQIFAPALTTEMKQLGLEESYQGAVYGNQMYEILARARLVINRHGNPISTYGNVRTFEVTGMGAGLLTEMNPRLKTIFEPNKEVFTYTDITDIGIRAKSILDTPEDLRVVSASGCEKTLAVHTYQNRYKDLEFKLSSTLLKKRQK